MGFERRSIYTKKKYYKLKIKTPNPTEMLATRFGCAKKKCVQLGCFIIRLKKIL